MDTDTPDDATVAAVFRAALSLGIATPADLVPWADEQILARERPAEWIIDLSIGAAVSGDQVSTALRDIAENADPAAVFHLLLGLICKHDHWTFDQASKGAAWMCRARGTCGVPLAWPDRLAGIDRLFCFAEQGDELIDPDRLTTDAIAFVDAHADPAARAWLPGVRVTFD